MAAEAADLVRFFLRKTSGGKERMVAVLDWYVKVVRTDHCFLLLEELGRRDGWVKCLEVCLVCANNLWTDTARYFRDELTHLSKEIRSSLPSKGQELTKRYKEDDS